MLPDFLEANKVPAKLFECPKEFFGPKQISVFFKLPLSSVAKAALFMVDREPVLVVIGADKGVSLEKLKALFGAGECAKASEEECVEITGYVADCMPPISIYGVPTIIDEGLFGQKEICCYGGKKNCVLRIGPEHILEHGFEARKECVAE